MTAEVATRAVVSDAERWEHVRGMMRHALGLDGGGRAKRAYRNFFDAGDDDRPAWDQLVSDGLAELRRSAFVEGGVYALTTKGVNLVTLPQEREKVSGAAGKRGGR